MPGLSVVATVLKVVPRLPSMRYSTVFALVSTVYVSISANPKALPLLIAIATLFSASLSYADSRIESSIIEALTVCGAKTAIVRSALLAIAAPRVLIATVPTAVASSIAGAPQLGVALALAPLAVAIAMVEARARKP